MNRFDRITAILLQLQSKKVVKAQELADRFEISLRTVYRDMNSLSEAGVPLVAEAGRGYSLVEGYRLPPIHFTTDEARSFIAAEKLVQRYTDHGLAENYQSAISKVKAVLRMSEKDMVNDLENHILVRDLAPNFPTANHLDVLLQSISERRALAIQYLALSTETLTNRIIEPVGIYHEHYKWYVIAYCHLRNEYRNFRTDRMQQITILDQKFELQHAPLTDFLKHQSQTNGKFQQIIISVPLSEATYLTERKYYFGYISEVIKDGQLQLTFLTTNPDYFARWFLALGPNARIVEPASFKSTIRTLIKGIQANL
ncbi:putative DNA-binding transcriptional regulator YafY [Dyadobacter jejuensis]|uniref:Putative DNA-binding transcriptional regulator YafY n=1 Tax=Dyadobacter jejuensis TaxID=1082580 RepID=A0A316APC0_9BACT|nr:YafY family protein [Dyadobacter jejuensis]PWJ58984.1 putative DNA-binding transcriptional regulator YafY [Dyadobacter jejuensis]